MGMNKIGSIIVGNKVRLHWIKTTFFIFLLLLTSWYPKNSTAADNIPDRRVNIPYLGKTPPAESFTPAIFWFGKVEPTSNNADVRLYYFDEYMSVVFHVIDRLLWFDPAQSESDLTQWDAVSLYLNMDGINSGSLNTNAYLLQSQLDFQAAYRGDGTTWVSTPLSFKADASWRGTYPNNDTNDKGWQVKFDIPFTSLGLSGPPPQGTIWGLAAMVHDRDDEVGSPIPDQIWPGVMEPGVPSTWGQIRFGVPVYTPPATLAESVVTIRNGLNGAFVEDAHVGGHTTCGADVDHWSEWGEENYAGYTQINTQNQWDISDWPCFSKYYITIPLDSLPPGKVIIDASLTMVLFGNAGGGDWGEPPDSYIQVFTVAEDWAETTLNWNNAPMALENISGTWVYPRDYDLPDQPYHWDVSKAVHEAYVSGEPLRLAQYSADGERHTGKYFWSSDVGDWNANARPTLRVTIGDSSVPPQPSNRIFTYLPQVLSSNH